MRSALHTLCTVALVLGLAVAFGPQLGRAQDASGLLASPRATMQDLENNAMRNTIQRVSIGPDATSTSGAQANVFAGLQQGNGNRIDARQTGIGNVIQITQNGDMHSATIVQSGSSNWAAVRQGR